MKNKTFYYLSIFFLLFLFHCSRPYLSEKSRVIHTSFWAADSLLHGYIMKGTKYETPVFHFASASNGPTVLILGGTHGNEPAGFETAHRLLKQFSATKLQQGDIFIIPEANKIADLKNKRRIPVPDGVDIERGNLNRCYPGDSTGLPMEQAAFQITKLIREENVGLLLDLHESPVFHLEWKDNSKQYHGLGQTLIYTPNEKATWLGMVVLDNLNGSIPPGVKQFSLAERPIKHSAAWLAGEIFNISGFTVETCKKLPLEERIQYQLKIVNTILREMGMF